MMQPPGRIEQLNNFQDSMQSPDGLDRLRAMQYIQASSQGLSGMPQVTVPQMQPQVPMMNRQDGGPVIHKFMGGEAFANFIKSKEAQNLFAPTPQVVEEVQQQPIPNDINLTHSNTAQGILNRSIQGGTVDRNNFTSPVVSQPQGASDQALSQLTLMGDAPQDQALGQAIQPQALATPMQGEFKDKAAAMAHARENQGGGLVNVYQLGDGSWDYQRTGRPTSYAIGAEPNSPFAMADGGQIGAAQAAQGIASLGRNGDEMLLHIKPEELDGLASIMKITYNPVTGMPEAWGGFRSIFRAVRKLAPIALAIAAPYAFGATTALGIGAATAGGSFFGNLIAGAKPKDALKAGLMSGLFAGGGAYLGGASSGFGSAGSSAGQGAAGYGSAAMQGSSAGVNSLGGATYGSSAGTTALKTGLGAPASMGAKGFSQGMAGGGGSEFSGIASYGGIPKATS